VLLLRRLDSGLGRLIAAKIQAMAQERMSRLGDVNAALRARVGLTGSGFANRGLGTLLAAAFDAVDLARKRDVALHCDLDEAELTTSESHACSMPRPAVCNRGPEIDESRPELPDTEPSTVDRQSSER
jgi:hypothetical protein